MQVGTIAEIWRYPVKSMAGERLETARLGGNGIAGDRGWALRDEAKGEIRGAKKLYTLLQLAARYLAEPDGDAVPDAEIALPDGTRFRASDPEAGAILSRHLGRAVTLWPLQPAADSEFYRRAPPDLPDVEAEFREIFGRTEDEPLPDMAQFPQEVHEFTSPRGTFFDVWPLHFLARATLDTLQKAAPGSRIDVRRFRPNFVVDGTAAGYPETGWVGRRLRVGEAVIEVPGLCPRCVMTTLAQADLPKDPGIMRTIVRDADQNIGAYGAVVRPGAIRVGDPVALVD